MPKVALHNLGCKVNYYETEAMRNILEEAGYTIVSFEEQADLYIINTCSVTAIADKKSRQMIHRAKALNPEAVICACGCFVQTAGIEKAKECGADIVVGNNEKHRIMEFINEYAANHETIIEIKDINHGKVPYESLHIVKDSDRTRAFIKVQDGCNRFCSYCIIPYARGRARSRKIEDVVAEVKALSHFGFKEVVLTGIHVTSFGEDTGESFIELMEAVEKVEGIERIRLGSLEPIVVTEDFAKRAAALKKLCPHFHLSLQSGCDKTLKEMNRKYTAKEFMTGVKLLRKYFKNPALTTDVIVGFPGETEEDFAESYEFVKEVAFAELHVFPYSKREGTKAAARKDQLKNATKKDRSDKLISLGKEMTEEYLKASVGQQVEVLFEEPVVIEGKRYFTGKTKEYITGVYETDLDLENTIMVMKIASIMADGRAILEKMQ